jgi:hypothetical protein
VLCGNSSGDGSTVGTQFLGSGGSMATNTAAQLAVPFSFFFFGNDVTNQIYVSSNFAILFGKTNTTAATTVNSTSEGAAIFFGVGNRKARAYKSDMFINATDLYYTRVAYLGNSVNATGDANDVLLEMFFIRDEGAGRQYITFHVNQASYVNATYGTWGITDGRKYQQLFFPDNPTRGFQPGFSVTLCSDLNGMGWESLNSYVVPPLPPPSPPPPAPPSPSPPPPRPPPSPRPPPPTPPPRPPPSPPPSPPPPRPPPTPPPSPPPAPSPEMYEFTSPSSNITYKLNTDLATHFAAQQSCMADGGFLVSYSDAYEQVRVRQ